LRRKKIGKKHTKESKEKISNALKGRVISEEHRRKISESHKGIRPSEETRVRIGLSKIGKKWNRGRKHSDEMKLKVSKARLGKKHSMETRQKIKDAAKRVSNWGGRGTKRSPEWIRRQSERCKGQRTGDKNPAWNGGTSFEPYDINFNNQFKKAIRKRDNQVCMVCGIHREQLNIELTIHHIDYNKKLSIPQNCVSLCTSCHGKTGWNRPHWIKFFQSLLAERYGYKYSELNEVVLVLEK